MASRPHLGVLEEALTSGLNCRKWEPSHRSRPGKERLAKKQCRLVSQLSLDDLLADLRDDGVMESSGNFTLDPKKAEEKLRNFSFSSAFDYVLKIVQCAVASGAPRIDIEVNARTVEVVFDGEPFTQNDMKRLIGHWLSETSQPGSRRFRHLAAGLRGAVAVAPSAVSFESWGESGGLRRTWDDEGWNLRTLESGRLPKVNTFTLTRTLGQSLSAAGSEFMSLFNSHSDGDLGEEEALKSRCEYSPVPIYLDGEKVSGFTFGAPLYPGYKIENDPNPGEARPPHYVDTFDLIDDLVDPNHHLFEECLPAEDGSSCSLRSQASQATVRSDLEPGTACQILMGVRAELGANKAIYVEDGVTLCSKEPVLVCPGVLALVSAETLNKDLTGFQLVEDNQFEAKKNQLFGMAINARSQLMENLKLYSIRETIKKRLSP